MSSSPPCHPPLKPKSLTSPTSRLWEGSWAPDAINPDPANDSYADPDKIRTINHQGKYFSLSTRHIVDPSPQRTPFLFQAGTSAAGSDFAATHAEGIFVQGTTPESLRPKIRAIRDLAAAQGRDPASLKFFATFTPILGATQQEADAKLAELKRYASTVGGLVLFSGWTGIDISRVPIDQVLTEADSLEANRISGILSSFTDKKGADAPEWTPRLVSERSGIGGLGPVSVGTPETVADDMERWVRDGDLDGFNIAYVTTPGTFEDVVDLLVPELRRRGVYPPQSRDEDAPLTIREQFYGRGQSGVRDDHVGSRYKYDVYEEDAPYVPEEGEKKE